MEERVQKKVAEDAEKVKAAKKADMNLEEEADEEVTYHNENKCEEEFSEEGWRIIKNDTISVGTLDEKNGPLENLKEKWTIGNKGKVSSSNQN